MGESSFDGESWLGRVYVFNLKGEYVREFGADGVGGGQLSLPTGIAVDSIGNVYVTDLENNEVSIFDGNDLYVSSFSTLGGGQVNGKLISPTDIEIDQFDNGYVVDFNNSRIQIFDSSGVWQRGWTCGEDFEAWVPECGGVSRLDTMV